MSERADGKKESEKRRKRQFDCCLMSLLCTAKANKWRSKNWSHHFLSKFRWFEDNIKFSCIFVSFFKRTLVGNQTFSTLFSLILKLVLIIFTRYRYGFLQKIREAKQVQCAGVDLWDVLQRNSKVSRTYVHKHCCLTRVSFCVLAVSQFRDLKVRLLCCWRVLHLTYTAPLIKNIYLLVVLCALYWHFTDLCGFGLT